MLQRSIDRVTSIPPLGPGFDGERHRAALVIAPGDLPSTDPFFLMADDNITLEGRFGDAHPHAGLETVTFMLKGTMEDTGGRLEEGDVEWMTAGSGIVHAAAPTLNAVPVVLVDIHLEAGATFLPQLPASYNAFIVTMDGEVEAGATGEPLATSSVGWTPPMGDGVSSLALRAGDRGARVLLYAGQPQHIEVVAQGPFIAGSRDELAGYYASYRQGKFPHAGIMRPVAHA